MFKLTKISILLTISMLLSCCSKITTKDYINNNPKIDIRQYLNGKVEAFGILEDRSGKITRRFKVDMIGSWQKNEGILQEEFTFDDGKKDHRIWKIKFDDDNNFSATAGDVIGIAKGVQDGNAVNMNYVLNLKVDNKSYNVNVDDWMYLIDEKTLINKSTIKKFGITFAKLTIFFQKIDE